MPRSGMLRLGDPFASLLCGFILVATVPQAPWFAGQAPPVMILGLMLLLYPNELLKKEDSEAA